MAWKIALTLIVSISYSSWGFAQNNTVADLARQERTRRQEAAKARPSATEILPALSGNLLEDTFNLCGIRPQLATALTGSSRATRELSMREFSKSPTSVEYDGVYAEAMNPDRLVPLMERHIAANANGDLLTEMVKWCSSALGRKVVHADLEAAGPDKVSRVMQYSASLQLNPPSNRRLELVRQITVDANTIEYNVRSLVAFVRGMHSAARLAGRILPPLPGDFENEVRSQLTTRLSEAQLLYSLYNYKSLSDDELSAFHDVAKTPAFIAFNNVGFESVVVAFEDAGKHVGKELSRRK